MLPNDFLGFFCLFCVDLPDPVLLCPGAAFFVLSINDLLMRWLQLLSQNPTPYYNTIADLKGILSSFIINF